MEAGDRMFYSSQVVDGHVTALGGRALREHIEAEITADPAGWRCQPGDAVLTPALGDLALTYSVVAHAVAPQYGEGKEQELWRRELASCYVSALQKLWFPEPAAHAATEGSSWWPFSGAAPTPWTHETASQIVATPLLGAGAKLAPLPEAAKIAAEAMASIDTPLEPPTAAEEDDPMWGQMFVVRFGVVGSAAAETLAQALDRALRSR